MLVVTVYWEGGQVIWSTLMPIPAYGPELMHYVLPSSVCGNRFVCSMGPSTG